MKIKVLGASGSEVAGHLCPAFCVDDIILLDAGTVGVALNIREESRIRHVFLTHAHFDHIKGLPFLFDNLVTRGMGTALTVMGCRETIDDLRTNLFNERIWPDFTRIPTPDEPVLRYEILWPNRTVTVDGYRVTTEKVNHTVPAFGYVVENENGKAIAYTGDTGPTDLIWKRMAAAKADCLIVETSFPNRLEEVALHTGHLTPSLLAREIAKMDPAPPRILLMHGKPQFLAEIEEDLRILGRPDIRFLKEGEILEI